MKKPAERFEVILAYLRPWQAGFADHDTPYTVDILNSDFVWHYLERTGAKYALPMYGAPRCETLGRDLSAMFRAKKLERRRTAMGAGSVSEGFPPWVWSYYLPKTTWADLAKPKA